MQGVAASIILFSQISKQFIQLPENDVIMLKFNDVRMTVFFMTHDIIIYAYLLMQIRKITNDGNLQCVFWDFNKSSAR